MTINQKDRRTLAKLRRDDDTLSSPRAVTFRSPKDYRRKPKHVVAGGGHW
jgi:hypothetical protein